VTLDAALRARVGALDLDLDLTAGDDEVVAILGPNGAGKTTVLRILAGLRAVDDGHVRLGDDVLDDPSAGVFVVPERRPVGVVFQDYLLFPYLSALDNVAFGLRSRGTRKAEARRIAREWLDRVGLTDHVDDKPSTLSGGQAQRVALARALATSPALLLLDEPLAALDASARGEIRRELRKHLATFAGVRLLVTHDAVDAATLADRLLVIEDGRISQTGTFDEISAHPRSGYVAELVGLNLWHGRASGGSVALDSGGELVIADTTVAGDVFVAASPRAVALFVQEPQGSPRNRWSGTVTDLDVVSDRVRVRIDGQVPVVAEITRGAASDLGLVPGASVWSAIKATDVDVYPS
jgi:molybdate transport system ATP-binding protein